MKPAGSIVFFTTASGAGYGMLFWLGLLSTTHTLPTALWYGLTALTIAGALVTAGLLSSTAHLGNPQRAWRALSQWRSSWLSREGIAALLTYIPAGLLALSWLIDPHPAPLTALLAAALALATVYCTAMIYASLKPIRQWNNAWVAPFYLLAALFTGAICLAALTGLANPAAAATLSEFAMLTGLAAALVKLLYWRHIDTTSSASTVASATGLGHLGPVRSFEAPHSEENYLLKEMGFRIARKHAAKLRAYALLFAFAFPIAILLGVDAGFVPVTLILIAAPCALLGMALERWLFFAEATHTVVLFYGRQA
jgi:DMSO reductase anchor subunit